MEKAFVCGDSGLQGIKKYNQQCLTRSEICALWREAINARKHSGDVRGVCDHLFEGDYKWQIKYIREKLEHTSIVCDDYCTRKHLGAHSSKINRLFKSKKTLLEEYNINAGRYKKFNVGDVRQSCSTTTPSNKQ
ncbi:LEF-11 [Urbanus proteus nucleopolyhedrovirus]|uniref:Late expression factor 11 n=1 Tax=Urbanus proteus nucleopolyhedrovirus TaxID=1675866 RepID=A0A162GUI0_9ABAC|nr:LEF-11 [Urbanus proteus nucleopolyhedrovirus]AKR17344.1 LEF-11 [Urbanus proteus nucleopolyhedrovirus]